MRLPMPCWVQIHDIVIYDDTVIYDGLILVELMAVCGSWFDQPLTAATLDRFLFISMTVMTLAMVVGRV